LAQRTPAQAWPAASTIGAILQRAGLVVARRRRRRTPYATQPLAAATAPNVVWCADFKGHFRVGGRYCFPLTITDAFSRFLVRCQGLTTERLGPTRAGFEAAFREYGLPLRMRTDNGSPFASRAVGGLSQLAIWWIKLGITPERIRPGHPEENGRHERMHRTLKDAVARPPRSEATAQQAAFDAFRLEYNTERPHEALGQQTPASRYIASPRALPATLADPAYPADFAVRRVHPNGTVKWVGTYAVLGAVLAGEAVGLEPVSDGAWQVWFGPIYLGLLRELGKHRVEFRRNVAT
jgi:transposase InsO family protein